MLKLFLLGRPKIILDEAPVTEFVSEKALALLCYLAVRSGGTSRDTLAGLLWSEMPEARAKANLRMALYNIQQRVPGYLTVSRTEAAFNHNAPYWLDLDQLSLGPSKIDAPPGQIEFATLQLYRGEFLEGLYLDGVPDFDEWLLIERERFRQLALNTAQEVAERAIQHGDYPVAIQALRRTLEIEPWQENTHRELMLALARTGNTTGALAQYANCRQVLAEGLGIDPMPETTALAERIHTARQQARSHNFPSQPTPFVGRSTELASLHKWLRQPQWRLITLTGPGGIGKTRLALQAASDLVPYYFEGVYFISVSTLDNVESLGLAILDVLGIPLLGIGDTRKQLTDFIQAKEMLLVLDSFEHLLEGAVWISELLKAAPGVRFLVTSRQRLNIQWEITYPLEGLEYPQEGGREDLEPYSAIQFFLQCIHRVKPGFTLSPGEQAAIRRLCQITEGMPLALELAASWTLSLTLQAIVDGVQGNLDLLTTNMQDAPPHHRSLRAACEKSWEMLTAIEQESFRRLSVFRGGFSPEAAWQVSGASLEDLHMLVAKSLIRQGNTGRYDLHEMLRAFASDKMSPDPDKQISLSRQHSQYYCTFLQQRENRIIGDDMADTIQVIRSELDNVRAAWSWAGTQCDLDAINKGMRCLSLFYEITSMLQEGERAFSQVVNALNAQQFPEPGKTAPVLSRLLVEKARYLRALSRHEEALQALAEAKTIIKMNPEPVTEATAYLQWAENLERQGDYYGAGKHYKKALALAQKIKSPPLQSSSHIGLGIITGEGGNIAGAVIHFQKALQLSRSNGDRHGENVALHNLSIAAMYQNNMTSARSFFEQQLALVRSLGNRRFEVMVLLAINILSSHFGDYAHLEEHSEKAIQICQEIGDRRELGSALDGSGLAAVCQGRYEDANRALEQALIHHTETGDRAGECISRMYLSLVHRALGEYTQAGNELEGTLTVLRELKAHRDECILLSHLSVTQYLTGEYTRAYQTAIESHELSHQIGDRSLQATALTAMGLGLEGLGNIDEAAVVHQQAQNLRVEAGQEHLVPYNIASLASIALAQGNIPLAQTFGESILHIVIEKPLQGFEPNHVYYAAYCALQAAKDTRSRQVLDIAHQQLQAQAKGIQHPGQRKSFFEKVAANRALLKAWKDIQPTPG